MSEPVDLSFTAHGARGTGDDMAQRFNSPPNWPPPPQGWTPPPGWQPDPAWGPPPAGWPLWVTDAANSRSTNNRNFKIVGALVGAFLVFAAGVAAGSGTEPAKAPEALAALSVPTKTITMTAEPTSTPTVTETVRKRVFKTVTATVSAQALGLSGAGGGSGGGTDPRFPFCYNANDAGYGPYRQGSDPEYDWYRDADGDGVVCEY